MSIVSLPNTMETIKLTCSHIGHEVKTAYTKVCDTANYMDRKFTVLTERLCHGNKEIAAFIRVSIKAIATFSLFSLCPFQPLVRLGFLGAELLQKKTNQLNRPWYTTTALIMKIFEHCMLIPFRAVRHPLALVYSILMGAFVQIEIGKRICKHAKYELQDAKAQAPQATPIPVIVVE